jgi:hypothetical protein
MKDRRKKEVRESKKESRKQKREKARDSDIKMAFWITLA